MRRWSPDSRCSRDRCRGHRNSRPDLAGGCFSMLAGATARCCRTSTRRNKSTAARRTGEAWHPAGQPEEVEISIRLLDMVFNLQARGDGARSAKLAYAILAEAGVAGPVRRRMAALMMAGRRDATPESADAGLPIDNGLSSPDRPMSIAVGRGRLSGSSTPWCMDRSSGQAARKSGRHSGPVLASGGGVFPSLAPMRQTRGKPGRSLRWFLHLITCLSVRDCRRCSFWMFRPMPWKQSLAFQCSR